MTRTTSYITRPPFVVDALVKNSGRQINWTKVAASRAQTSGKKNIPAGTVMGLTVAGTAVPRADTVSVSALAVVGTTATATSTAHGFLAGDAIAIGGATPTWLRGASTVATVADANTFTFVVTPPVSTAEARAVTLTAATNLVNLTAHGLIAGDLVEFEEIATTTGLDAGTNYYVIATGLTANVFSVSATAGGGAIDLATGDGTALVRAVAGGTYTAGGTITAAYAAACILETSADEDDPAAALTGFGCLIGGVLFENLLPDATGTPAVLPAVYKTELARAGVGTGFAFEQYADDRT